MALFSLSCSSCAAENAPDREHCHQCGHLLEGSSPVVSTPQPLKPPPKRSRRAILWSGLLSAVGAVLLSTGGYLTYRKLTDPHLLTYADKDEVLDVAWSFDGTRVASVSGDGNTVQIWRATTGEKLVTCSPKRPVSGGPLYLPTYWFDAGGKRIAWSEDDKHVLALVGPSKGPTVQVWNAEDGQVMHSFPVTPSLALGENQGGDIPLVNAWALHARYLAVARLLLETKAPYGQKSFVDIWDITSGSRVLSIDTTRPETSRNYQVSTMVWAPAGEKLAVGYTSGGNWYVEIWDRLTGTRTPVLAGGAMRGTVAWSPQGTMLAVATPQGTVICEAQTGRQVTAYALIKTQYSLAWSPDGKRIAMTSYSGGHYWVPTDGTLTVFDASDGSLLAQYDQGQWDIPILGMGRMAWSPNGQFLVVVNGGINLWKIA